MANVEMVRMIRQDKKLSNPSKPSGRNNADFSHMLSAKAADVRDAGLPRPDGKVREKEDGGQTKPKEEPDADDFQTLKLHHDFAARFEWGMSQSIPVCGELLLEQGEAVPDLEFVKAQQSGIAEGENTARIIAESRTIPEETAAPRKMLQAEQETKGSKTMADMGLPMDGTEKLQKTGAGQDSHALRQEKAGDLKEGSKPQADEPSSQADGKIAEIGSKEKEAGRGRRWRMKRRNKHILHPRRKAAKGRRGPYIRRSDMLRQSERPGRNFRLMLEKPLPTGCRRKMGR